MTQIIRFVEKLEINTYDNKKYFVLKEYEKAFKEKIENTKFITVTDSQENRRTLNVSNIRDFGIVKIDNLEECLTTAQKEFVNDKMKGIVRDSQDEMDKTRLHWINKAKRQII